MHYDEILELAGSFGKYQKIILFCVLVPALFPCGFLYLNAVYMVATPSDHWCKLPIQDALDDQIKRLLPQEIKPEGPNHSRCQMYDYNYSSISSANLVSLNLSQTDAPLTSCKYGWDYDKSVYQTTLVTEYDLVCDQHLLPATSFAIFGAGGFFGPILWGFLADRLGRKKAYFMMISLQSLFSIGTFFTNGFIWFCICRFFVGATVNFSYSLPFIMSIELTGSSTRVLMSVICSAGYSLSVMAVAGIAYPFRDWRTVSLATGSPLLLIFLLWKVFPESPRWLLARGRYDEVEIFIRKVARINGRTLPKEVDTNLHTLLRKVDKENHSQKHSLLDLFKTPNLRKKTLILIFLNFCNTGIFVGLNYYAPAFGKDPHLNSFLSALVEIPPLLCAALFCERFGRRACVISGMFLGAVSSLAACAIPEGQSTAITVLSLSSKLWISFTFIISELLEEEIFPTVVRGEGHSVTSFMSNTAAVAAPFVVYLGHSQIILPLAIFGVLCLFAGFFALFLPETTGTELPQTIQDGEEHGKNMTWKDVFTFRVEKLPKPDLVAEIEMEKNQGVQFLLSDQQSQP